MRGQAQVVVRREVDDRLVVDGGMRLLLVVQDPELTEELLFAERVQFLSQVGERVVAHSRRV